MKNDLLEKAEGLLEALPYIQKFRGAGVVIKFGGMREDELKKLPKGRSIYNVAKKLRLMRCGREQPNF